MHLCPFCQRQVKALRFHVAAECNAESKKKLSSSKIEALVSEALLEQDKQAKEHEEEKLEALRDWVLMCDAVLHRVEGSIQSNYQQSIFYACGAILRGGTIQRVVHTKPSGAGGWVTKWIVQACENSGFELKTRDAEMKVLSELEHNYKKPDDTFVILSGEGPCKSCKDNLNKLVKRLKLTVVVGYLKAPYQTVFSNKQMWYGWENDPQVGSWYVHVLRPH